MTEEFVNKEVFDARMDRMEAIMEKTLMEMKADNEKLRSEVKEEVNGLRSEIRMFDTRVDALGSRIDTVQTTISCGFAIIAIVLACLSTIQNWHRMFHKPAVTMEDVERAISAAIAQVRLEGK